MLQATRAWLKTAYQDLATSASLHSQRFLQQSRQTRVTFTVVKAVVSLIFDPPASPSQPESSAPSSTASTPTISSPPLATSRSHGSSSLSSSSSSFAGYPETFFLDYGRLATLGTDAADFTTLYMLLMLYRQLVHSHLHRRLPAAARAAPVTNDELLQLKKEIWEIGPSHLGLCFMQNRPRSGGSSSGSSHSGSGSSRSSSRHERSEREREAEMRKWRSDIADVVLQVTRRASEPRGSQGQNALSTTTESAGSGSSSSADKLRAPDTETLKLTSSWAENNLRPGSALSTLMKKRIRECVEEAVLAIVLPSSSSSSSPSSSASASGDAFASLSSPSSSSSENDAIAAPTSNGLEPLMPEIRHLAERAARLVTIHTNVYGALYAHPSFLQQQGDTAPTNEAIPIPLPGSEVMVESPASSS